MSNSENEQVPVPAVPIPRSTVVAAGQQAIERIKRPVMNVAPDEAVPPDPNAEILRANQYRSGGWVHGPAHLELFANTDRRLTKIANQLGDPGNVVERVQACRIKGSQIVYLWPTHKEDPDGLEVKRYNSSAWINLNTLLGPAGMTLESAYKQRYEINYSQPEDHVYPALKIDMSRVLERRSEGDSGGGGSNADSPA